VKSHSVLSNFYWNYIW